MAEIVHPFGRKARTIAVIEEDYCTGCGWCAMFCVMHCIDLRPDGIYQVDAEHCIGCRSCKVNCFSEAVRLVREEPT